MKNRLQRSSFLPAFARRFRGQASFGFVTLLVSFLLAACETVVDVDIPIEKPLLVINGLLEGNEHPVVSVTYSKHILDNAWGFRPVTNAQVHVKEEDGPWTPLQRVGTDQDTSYRSSEISLKEAHTYTYRIQVPDYNDILVSERIPSPVPVSGVTHNATRTPSEWSVEEDFTVSFPDPVGKNYYELTIHASRQHVSGYDEEGNPIYYSFLENIFFYPKNPVYENDFGSSLFLLFDDKLFEGQQANIDVLVYSAISDENYNEVYFNLRSVSESYYLYHTTAGLQYWNDGDPFAQPVQVYTNIPGGLGILTASSLSSFRYR